MKERKTKKVDIPDLDLLENELKRVKTKSKFNGLLRNTVYTLIVVASIAVLVAVFFMPVLRIYGSSMEPTLEAGDIVVSIKTSDIKAGDIVGIYYGSKLLVKRVIATENQVVDFDKYGNVYIDGSKKPLNEPYVNKLEVGELDIDLPYTVPTNMVFIMGDNRHTSTDSRSSSMGAISKDEIVGKIMFRAWPIKKFGKVN